MKLIQIAAIAGLAVLTTGLIVGCNPPAEGGTTGTTTPTTAGKKVEGTISIDGSSTVTPILEAVTEEFSKAQSGVNVTVGTSGTGGGMKKFISGEIDMAMASRPIKDEEAAKLKEAGIEFIEIPVAYDGLTVVINPANKFVDYLTVEELNKIWAADSKVASWSEVRSGFPNEPIKLYGAGTDSGTFDYFTLAVNGKEGASRADYQASEDDNVLVQGVKGDTGALGYFGYAYFVENKDVLKAVPIKANATAQAISPSEDTIRDASYQPLSRPLFVYVNKAKMESSEALKELVRYLIQDSNDLIAETGYVPLSEDISSLVWGIVEAGKTGSRFHGSTIGLKMSDILAAEGK